MRIRPCAECGHEHFLGPDHGYCACPVDECECQGQPWAIELIGPFPQVLDSSV